MKLVEARSWKKRESERKREREKEGEEEGEEEKGEVQMVAICKHR